MSQAVKVSDCPLVTLIREAKGAVWQTRRGLRLRGKDQQGTRTRRYSFSHPPL